MIWQLTPRVHSNLCTFWEIDTRDQGAALGNYALKEQPGGGVHPEALIDHCRKVL